MRHLTLISLATVMALPASANPLLDLMRSHSGDGPRYAYEMTYSDGEVTATGKVDPSAAPGKRIEVYTPAPEDWPEGFAEGLKEMDAETDGDIWCADFAEIIPANASLTHENETDAVFSFTPLPEAGADNTEKKMMKKIRGEVTLDKADGAIIGFSMTLPKPYKPMMVAKINDFDMQANCTRAPDGRTYIETFSIAISGSAMMQSFEEFESRQITALLNPVE